MALRAKRALDALARELNLPGEAILEEGLNLEKKLRSIKAEIFQIAGKYGFSSVEGMEALYRRSCGEALRYIPAGVAVIEFADIVEEAFCPDPGEARIILIDGAPGPAWLRWGRERPA